MDLILIIVCLLFFAFFSGMEMAFFSANRINVEWSSQKGGLYGQIVSGFFKNPELFLRSTLLGKTIAIVVFGMLITKNVAHPLAHTFGSFWAVVIQVSLSSFLLVIVGKLIPRVVFKVFADKILAAVALPFYFIYAVLRIGVSVINTTTTLAARPFLPKSKVPELTLGAIDIDKYVNENSPDNEHISTEEQAELFENALYLKNIKVRECMVPRREISAIEIDEDVDSLKTLIIQTYHSRILVYEDSVDNMLGYVHHFDLHKKPKKIKDILLPILVVPDTMALQKLLNIFIKNNKSIAWVVDEYGGTAGVITLEDIIEEIFGEIDDEYDEDEYVEKQLSDNEFIMSGRLEIDYVNEEYNLQLPEGEYETLSGLIVANTGTIPDKNEEIEIGRYLFKILDVSDTKVETVKLTIQDEKEGNN